MVMVGGRRGVVRARIGWWSWWRLVGKVGGSGPSIRHQPAWSDTGGQWGRGHLGADKDRAVERSCGISSIENGGWLQGGIACACKK